MEVNMERKKIIFPKNYKNKTGEKKTVWRNGGHSFINYRNNEILSINLYLNLLPFTPNVRILLVDFIAKGN